VLAGAIGSIATAVLLRWGSDGFWWVEIVRYFPRVALLPPALLLVALAWRSGWAWRVLAMIAPLVIATELMGLSVGRADSGSGGLRFMTYNVKSYLTTHNADGPARLAWEIASQDADVIVMQDAQAVATHPDEAAPVRAALGGRQTYVQGQYIVASRYPMKDCGTGALSHGDGADDYVRCTITVDGTEVDVFTAHLLSPREGLDAARGRNGGGLAEWQRNYAVRLMQADGLVRGLAQSRRPMIVAGDLNAEEQSPVVRRLQAAGLRDAFGSAGLGYGYTHGHSLRLGFSFLRIDHILVSEGIGVRDCRVGGAQASEHRPVVADLLVHRDPG
jgi:endonuclease/exonuclease/phosphatase (EEP) superfamily protein YafD